MSPEDKKLYHRLGNANYIMLNAEDRAEFARLCQLWEAENGPHFPGRKNA